MEDMNSLFVTIADRYSLIRNNPNDENLENTYSIEISNAYINGLTEYILTINYVGDKLEEFKKDLDLFKNRLLESNNVWKIEGDHRCLEIWTKGVFRINLHGSK